MASPKTNSIGAGIVMVTVPVPESVAEVWRREAMEDDRSIADYIRTATIAKETQEGDQAAAEEIRQGLFDAYPRARGLWGDLKAIFAWNTRPITPSR